MIPLASLIFNPPTSRNRKTPLVCVYFAQHIWACVYSSNGCHLLALGRAMHRCADKLQAGSRFGVWGLGFRICELRVAS